MKHKARRRYVAILTLCLLIAACVVYLNATSGTTGIDASETKNYVFRKHSSDTAAENAVTAIYLNYRFWDTLFEALTLLISVLAIRLLSWNTDSYDDPTDKDWTEGNTDEG